MKKLLTLAAVFVAAGTAASAQQVEQMGRIEPIAIPLRGSAVGQPSAAPNTESSKHGATPQEVQSFGWGSQIIPRRGPGGDTNRSDITFPVRFDGGTIFKGGGQYFAPYAIHKYFSGSVYSTETNLRSDDTAQFGDQTYVDQFKGAKEYSIEGIEMQFFKNPYAEVTSVLAAEIYRVPTNYNTTADVNGSVYKERGFQADRDTLKKRNLMVREIAIDDIGLDTTVRESGTGYVINRTALDFSEEPIQFAANEAALVLIANDIGTPIIQPVGSDETETREYQRMIAYDEWFGGDIVPDPANPNVGKDMRVNPLDSHKTWGVVLFNQSGQEVIISAWAGLVFLRQNAGGGVDTIRSRLNMDMNFFGRVDLVSGVSYHFGKDTRDQGLGEVFPNPVSSDVRVPFSLGRNSHVKLELFDGQGRLVKHLAESNYVEGNYSVVVPVNDLTNGTYLVRMVAGNDVYSTKLNVVK